MFNLIRNLHLSLSLGQVGSLRLRPPENLRLRKKKTLVTINHRMISEYIRETPLATPAGARKKHFHTDAQRAAV